MKMDFVLIAGPRTYTVDRGTRSESKVTFYHMLLWLKSIHRKTVFFSLVLRQGVEVGRASLRTVWCVSDRPLFSQLANDSVIEFRQYVRLQEGLFTEWAG